jgi:hypothetical protein
LGLVLPSGAISAETGRSARASLTHVYRSQAQAVPSLVPLGATVDAEAEAQEPYLCLRRARVPGWSDLVAQRVDATWPTTTARSPADVV